MHLGTVPNVFNFFSLATWAFSEIDLQLKLNKWRCLCIKCFFPSFFSDYNLSWRTDLKKLEEFEEFRIDSFFRLFGVCVRLCFVHELFLQTTKLDLLFYYDIILIWNMFLFVSQEKLISHLSSFFHVKQHQKNLEILLPKCVCVCLPKYIYLRFLKHVVVLGQDLMISSCSDLTLNSCSPTKIWLI